MVVLRHTPAGCLLSVPLAELQIIIKASCLSFFPVSRQELLGTVHFDIATTRNWQPRYFGAQTRAHTLVSARQSKEGDAVRVRGGVCEHIVKVCFSNFLSRLATKMYRKPGEKRLKPASSFRLRVFQNFTIFATTFKRLREETNLKTSVSLLSSLTYTRLGPAHSLEWKIPLCFSIRTGYLLWNFHFWFIRLELYPPFLCDPALSCHHLEVERERKKKILELGKKKGTWGSDSWSTGKSRKVGFCLLPAWLSASSAIRVRTIWGVGNNRLPVMPKNEPRLGANVSIDQFSAPTASFFISTLRGGVCAAQDATAR